MTQVLPRFHRRQEKIRDQRKQDEAVNEAQDHSPVVGATGGGDGRKLRGIPCVARSVTGTSPGTDPYLAIQHWPER